MVFTNIQPFPFQMSPLSNVTPFTYRDGQTFQEKLELMRVWLNQSLVPDTDASIANAIDEFQTGIKNAEQTVLTAKAGWQATYDGWTTARQAEYDALVASITTNREAFEALINGNFTSFTNSANANYTQFVQDIEALVDVINNKSGPVDIQRATLVDNAYTVSINPLWPTNQPVYFSLKQDATGGRTVILGANITGPLTVNPAPGAVTEFSLVPDGTGKWDIRPFLFATGAVNVKNMGAKGDGVANDTAAIQRALDTGKAVYFPGGTYLTGALVKTSGTAMFGDGMNDVHLKALPGTGTMLTATQLAGIRIASLWFDGDNNAAKCIDTTWTIPAGQAAPSLNNVYSNIRLSKWTDTGWEARSNNDCTFESVLVEASGNLTGIRLRAQGGMVTLANLKSFAPLEIACQQATLSSCVTMGITVMAGDYNILNIIGGYHYAHPVTHANFNIAAGIAAFPLNIQGAHIENGYADGSIFRGPGQIKGQTILSACHVFAVNAGINNVKLLNADLANGGLNGRFKFLGGIVEGGLDISHTAAFRVLADNLNKSGIYYSGDTDWNSADGGGRTTIRQGGIFHSEGLAEGTVLAHKTIQCATGATVTIPNFPRSGLISIRGTDTGSPALIAAYNRLGALAGTVTNVAQMVGGSGSNITLSIPAGNAQSNVNTDLSVTHDFPSTLFLYITVLGN